MRNYKEKECLVCHRVYKPTTGHSKYCELCSGNKAVHPTHLTRMENPQYRVRRLLNGARARSREKGVPFNIDLAYLMDMYQEQEGKCKLTKIPFDLSIDHTGRNKWVNPDAPSIDRIIPEKGYTKGNIRLVTYHMNVALTEFGEEQFKRLASLYLGGIN